MKISIKKLKMLVYINIFLIRIFILLSTIILFSSTGLKAKTIIATYKISWNKIILGNILWEFNIQPTNYEFLIELENSSIASKLYPFYGKHSSSGQIIKGKFTPKKYENIWKTRKKEKLIEINFTKNKIGGLKIIPKQDISPFINFYKLRQPIDPVSAALDLIINNDKRIIKNVFDGRRVYELSVTKKKLKKTKHNIGILNQKHYELNITNYKNVWKDHNKTDLKKVEIVTGEIRGGLILPLNFKIRNKRLIFKIDYIGHKIKN